MTHAKNVPSPAVPDVHLLGNGRLGTMVSSAGGGSSRRGDVARVAPVAHGGAQKD